MQFDQLNRREFITLLGGAAAWPLAARAQNAANVPTIGFLNSESAELFAYRLRAFRQGLSEMGYVEGQNVAIEYRWADDHYERLPTLASDLVRRQVSVIAANPAIAAFAAKAATSTIPIVTWIGGDPIRLGLAASLNRPGGNITGVSTLSNELMAKRVDVLHELLPHASTLAFLVDPRSPNAESDTNEVRSAARVFGWQVIVLQAQTDAELDAIFASLAQHRASALVVHTANFLTASRAKIAALAARHRVATIYSRREFLEIGGLMSYGANDADCGRRFGVYAGRILRGAKPADLPFEQLSKFELVINLKAGKALGLEMPPSLLALADEVIE
jgi:putative ABC transport system substrate-binding protein